MFVNRSSFVGFLLLGIILIALPLTVFFSQQQQQTQQHAATSQPQPVGVPGSWTMVFDDEFNSTSLDTSKWSPMNGAHMNNVTTNASNIAVSGGNLILTLANSNSGAFVSSSQADGADIGFLYPVGDYVEARISFPGNGTKIYNWPAWWTSGPNWPAAGEHDIAEGLGTLTVNYHSPSGAHNQGTIPGTWSNAFHTYGLYRQVHKADVYWDGTLVKSYTTDDNGAPESILINVGAGNTAVYGTGSQVLVDYVRVWQPCPTNCISSTPIITPHLTSTPISSSGNTAFSLTLCPHGLGNCGDNANPNSTGNTNPKNPQRIVTLAFLNSQNQSVGTAQGIVSYNSAAGNFQGNSNANVTSGQYLIKVHTDGFLQKQVPGIITVSSGQTITLPAISLVAGDTNNDGQLDILDYNILISCFGSKFTSSSCTAPASPQSPGADIDDDGTVDGADYNLFLRELSVQHGG